MTTLTVRSPYVDTSTMPGIERLDPAIVTDYPLTSWSVATDIAAADIDIATTRILVRVTCDSTTAAEIAADPRFEIIT